MGVVGGQAERQLGCARGPQPNFGRAHPTLASKPEPHKLTSDYTLRIVHLRDVSQLPPSSARLSMHNQQRTKLRSLSQITFSNQYLMRKKLAAKELL